MTEGSVDLEDVRRRMSGATRKLKEDLGGLRTGRAHVGLLEPIVVEAYGARTPLKGLATITAPTSRLLQVQVWDAGLTEAVEKGLRGADLGATPRVEGNVMRIEVPSLTSERRGELAKLARRYGEEARTAIRGVRRKALDKVKGLVRGGEMGEDDGRGVSGKIEALAVEETKRVEEATLTKEEEIKGE